MRVSPTVRAIRADEAGAFLELRKATEAQSDFLLFEAGERSTSVEEIERLVGDFLSSPNSTILVAEDDSGRLVGFLSARGGAARRTRHAVEIVIAILDGYRGLGVGTRLFGALEEWARGIGVTRLALGHMADNDGAHALYVKMGFREEGRKKAVFLLKGRYVDEVLMYKLLDV
ncbi:MAG: GNAT family N-acetyltransferase [Spirochaetes bacterium]|nr:GNAT family N-acetyltransferase [Spirochaetota bacterium]MBU1082272.1 GNAT family N-acetyltransferase [Spirochaetota bacterium]